MMQGLGVTLPRNQTKYMLFENLMKEIKPITEM
jgi:hypothetical protein